MHEMEYYFFSGEVHKSLATAKQVASDAPEAEMAQQFMAMYAQHGIEDIPMYTATSACSLERADETYPENDEVAAIRAIRDEAAFKERISQLEHIAKEGVPHEKAQSFYTQAQLFLYAHHYDESVHCFKQAVKHAPNNAVYYGMAAQTMARVGNSPIEALGYIERAIELDSQNARWYWNRALMLTTLYKDLQQQDFLEHALRTLEQAQAALRADQLSLKSAIDNTFEGMKDYLFQ